MDNFLDMVERYVDGQVDGAMLAVTTTMLGILAIVLLAFYYNVPVGEEVAIGPEIKWNICSLVVWLAFEQGYPNAEFALYYTSWVCCGCLLILATLRQMRF